MRSRSHDRGSWSRRRFLALGLTASALVPALPAAARAGLAAPAAGSFPPPPDRLLAIASSGRMNPALHAQAPVVLAGDRLSRLNQMRRLLQRDRPERVLLHLDATDRLMWDIATTDAGITVLAESGGLLRLVHRPAPSRSTGGRT